MRTTTSLILVTLVVAIGGALYALRTQLSTSWIAFGTHPEVLSLLEASLEDQRTLARDSPTLAASYHQRFDTIQAALNRLRILEHARERIIARYQLLLLAVLGGSLLTVAAVTVFGQRRTDLRLRRLGQALQELTLGHRPVLVTDHGRDALGRVARMVEETSRVVGTTRRRLASLAHLESWQEAARRQAHEMRTPLATARLELGRARELAAAGDDQRAAAFCDRLDSIAAELRRLEQFARGFASLARLPRPRREPLDLAALVQEFGAVYAAAWPQVHLIAAGAERPLQIVGDSDLLRQVLVNLCENSALAAGDSDVEVRLTLLVDADQALVEVADDGPGVAAEIRDRLFEPYATTRRPGEGSGLGLAISRKIALEHGGDLELVASERGAVFRLQLPRATEGATRDG